MNKAFLKEPDETGDVECPRCGAHGQGVGRETVEHHVRTEKVGEVAATAFFCPTPGCAVAYFDMFGRMVAVEDLKAPVYPKDLEAPMCACFGLTRDDVEADARDPAPTRLRALVEKTKSPDAQCAVLAANGQCCLPELKRYYMKLRAGGGSGGSGG